MLNARGGLFASNFSLALSPGPTISGLTGRMSDPNIWGPSLWRILHSLAERLGKQTNIILIQDEQRTWINFLRSVESVLPCKRCKTHYREWSLRRRIDSAANKIQAREWLWELHADINKERNVTGPTLDEMEAMYGQRTSNDLNRDSDEWFKHLTDAIQRGHITSESFRTFKYRLSLLRRFTG